MAASDDSFSLLSPRRRLLAGLVLALSNFMVVLDLTIANVSVPHIAGNMGITPDQGTWIITSYAVAEAICVPLTGWLAQRFGVVRVFMMSMAGFGLFSLLCGLSVTLGMIVVCRIGQGLCGGPIMPMSQTLLMRIFPPEQRAKMMGLWAMTTLLGPAMGPIIGGYISDNWSWHWIFFINLPIAALCIMAAAALLKPVETETRKLPIDFAGLALLVFWIGCLQIMLDIGRDRDWFGDPLIVILAIMAGVGFLVFIIWELTEEHPIVDLRVFRHVGFTSGVFTLALCFGAYFASIVVVPQWLQLSMGYTATWAGFVTAFTAMTALIAAPISGRMIARVDVRISISSALIWMGIMAFWRAHWTSGADFWALSYPQIFQGFAMPFFMIPLTTLSLSSVLPSETASAAGMQNFLRTMAIAISTSVVLTVWGDGQRVSRNEMASVLQAGDAQAQLSASGFSMEQARQVISNMVDQEAAVISMNYVFFFSMILMFLAAAVIWLAPKPTGKVDTSAAH
ncbi:DHA2 family multidrug resistance protein [Sphingobium wenxiniae]|uniref:DSBA oxidoreductase n=2 Tax=Sphingobium TaxID=165695 RepID=T0HN98_9SPHN|nr:MULTISPECIES: DHA2 family efflux MFS transporter permease subunit [Sphingobium]EQA99043.1 DSBA oxidoreductase [Sphingobium baderi LL03]KMS61501.1 DSBA oxidoreductase [Sphingobium baderi LL03]MBB6191780.1 DHA2 family multidrug resistance protein [Sphingobium wenxiniae]TWH96814.1 DHA2 family multidrug resistance protein [Sphingobium wenxiniae]WRD75202.1 DHA2 family efflux MFS transporter permease subunit [Sphingobium baderi]